jgi:ERF superfamily
MKTSSEITKIAPALLKAQRVITHAVKAAKNDHFKSRYADLAAVLEAVKEPLNAQGIVILQPATSDATGVMVETMLLHESGEFIAETLYIPVDTASAQKFGSAQSYARRYGLQSIIGLPAQDDDGNKASEDAPPSGKASKPTAPNKMATVQFVAHCTAMGNATKVEALHKAFTAAILDARAIGDSEAERSFVSKKDELKQAIEHALKLELASQA